MENSKQISKKIVSVALHKPAEVEAQAPAVGRPAVLDSHTIKLTTPLCSHNIYITISYNPSSQPYECFIHTQAHSVQEFVTSFGLCLSFAMRAPDTDHMRMLDKVAGIASPTRTYMSKGRTHHSLVGEIAYTIRQFLSENDEPQQADPAQTELPLGEDCPECGQKTLIKQAGCETCTNCGYSKCG